MQTTIARCGVITAPLLCAGIAQAADKPRAKVTAKASSAARTAVHRVVTPLDLVARLLVRGGGPTPAPMSSTREPASPIDLYGNLFAGGADNHDTLQLILSATRFRVWLRDDLNLQCDLEQDRAVVRGDQFALKLALQFRFR